MSDTPQSTPNIQELTEKGEVIYQNLETELQRDGRGKYIAIELNSGEHFIGETREEAVEASRKKYPDTLVYVRRIGDIETISRHRPLPRRSIYSARIF